MTSYINLTVLIYSEKNGLKIQFIVTNSVLALFNFLTRITSLLLFYNAEPIQL